MIPFIQIIRVSNEVIIAEIVEEKTDTESIVFDDYILLKEPFALIPTNDGKLNFIPWSPLSAEDTLVKLYKSTITYFATPNEDVLTNQDGSIEQQKYFNNAGDIYVEHIKVTGGGHYWDDNLNYNGTNTSGLIWQFVSNYDNSNYAINLQVYMKYISSKCVSNPIFSFNPFFSFHHFPILSISLQSVSY